jgi:hypothetical protein
MSDQSHAPKPSKPNGAQTFSVGYGRPPVHSRFKPGQSGNPKGRRKGQRNVRTVVDGELSQRITVREGNRTRSLTKLDAFVVTLVNAALKGDARDPRCSSKQRATTKRKTKRVPQIRPLQSGEPSHDTRS